MSTERQILKRLLEGNYEDNVRDEELDESGFEANGKVYKCGFGRYTCDGEPITRDAYFKAKQSTLPDKEYDAYTPEEFDNEIDLYDDVIDNIADDLKDIDPDDEDAVEAYTVALEEIDDKLADMEEYLSDEQYEKVEALRDRISKASEGDYDYKPQDPYASRGLKRSDFH